MEYTAKTPPSIEDPTIQIWSPDGHWIADVRERAWPGTVETVLAALNKHDALCQMLADYQLAIGACYKIMGLDENSTCCQLEHSMQIMMDDRYRLNDEIKKVERETAEKCFEIVTNTPLSANNYGDRVDYARLKIQDIQDRIVEEFNL